MERFLQYNLVYRQKWKTEHFNITGFAFYRAQFDIQAVGSRLISVKMRKNRMPSVRLELTTFRL